MAGSNLNGPREATGGPIAPVDKAGAADPAPLREGDDLLMEWERLRPEDARFAK